MGWPEKWLPLVHDELRLLARRHGVVPFNLPKEETMRRVVFLPENVAAEAADVILVELKGTR